MSLRNFVIGSAVFSALESVLVVNFAPHLQPSSGYGSLLLRFFLLNVFLSCILYPILIYPKYVSPLRHWPGPPDGNLFTGQLLRVFFTNPPGDVYREWIEQIPNDGVLRVRDVLGHSGLLLTSPATMKTVLVDNNYDYVKQPNIAAVLKAIIGNGVIVTEGDVHKFQRKHLLPSFQVPVIRNLYPVFWDKACELIYTMKEDVEKPEVEFGVWCTRVTLDIIGVGIGKDFNSLKHPDDEFVKMYAKLAEPSTEKAILFLLCLIFSPDYAAMIPFWPLPKEAINITERLLKYGHDLAKSRRAELNDPKISADEKAKRNDILSLLVKSNDFTDEELADQILTFMAAGHETTSNTLTWAVCSLAQHPKIMAELRDEIRTHLPSPSKNGTETISASVIDGMPLLNAVCNETLRLYPVVPITTREAIKDTVLAGHPIPKGTVIAISPWAINRNSRVWGSDANEFVPGRWINADGKVNNTGGASSNYDLMTFLHGPRSCLGQGFAKSELKCLLAAVIGRYDVETTRDKSLYYPAGNITTKAAHGMWLKFKEVPGW